MSHKLSKSDLILQHMSDGFVSVDHNQRITGVNHRFESYHGPRAALLGTCIWDVLPELKGTITEVNLKGALEQKDVRKYEDYNPKLNQWYDVRMIPTDDGVSIFYNDITERKLKEQQLIESENKFRRLSDSNVLGIVRFNEDGHWLDANAAVFEMLGFLQSDLERGLLDTRGLTPSEWHETDTVQMRNLMENGYMKPYEKEFFHRDGTRVPVLIGAASLDKNSGAGMAYILDLSISKRSEERIRLSAEAAKIAFWDWNIITDECHWTNPWPFFAEPDRARMSYNYKSNTAQFYSIVHPDDREEMRRKVNDAILRGIPYRNEYRIFTPDGRMHWIQGYSRTMFDKNGVAYRMVGTSIDVTELRSLTNELEESHRRLDVAINVAQVSVWELNLESMESKHSANHHKLFGVDQLPGRWDTESFLRNIHPDDRQMIRDGLRRAMTKSSPDQAIEFRTIWPDGSVHWIYSCGRVLENPATGKPQRFMGAAIEITDLKETQRKLEKAVSIRDEFLSVASHELRTPITSLNLQTQILQKLMSGGAENFDQLRVQKHLEATRLQIKKLTFLVDDLLDVTRISHGKLELAPERIDIAELVRTTYSSMQEQFISAKCHVDIVAPNETIGIWDKQKIEQVVVNLLTNACKYGRGKPIQIFVVRSGNMARLIVKDYGIGISQEYQTRIFERFERAVRGSAFSGLGLGLFISKQIVNAHEGEISVYSQEGSGSTFTVDLPLASPAFGGQIGAS